LTDFRYYQGGKDEVRSLEKCLSRLGPNAQIISLRHRSGGTGEAGENETQSIESLITGVELSAETDQAEKEAMDEYQLEDDTVDLIYI
jgi:hypothetical protein